MLCISRYPGSAYFMLHGIPMALNMYIKQIGRIGNLRVERSEVLVGVLRVPETYISHTNCFMLPPLAISLALLFTHASTILCVCVHICFWHLLPSSLCLVGFRQDYSSLFAHVVFIVAVKVQCMTAPSAELRSRVYVRMTNIRNRCSLKPLKVSQGATTCFTLPLLFM